MVRFGESTDGSERRDCLGEWVTPARRGSVTEGFAPGLVRDGSLWWIALP